MKWIILVCTIMFSTILSAQLTVQIVGTYQSNKKYNYVWILHLNTDFTYTFSSQQGEFVTPGIWELVKNEVVLKGEYFGKMFSMRLKIRERKDSIQLITPRNDFVKLKLLKQ